jgi:hypothetical protein
MILKWLCQFIKYNKEIMNMSSYSTHVFLPTKVNIFDGLSWIHLVVQTSAICATTKKAIPRAQSVLDVQS